MSKMGLGTVNAWLLASCAVLGLCQAAQAQPVLDRVDPAQEEEAEPQAEPERAADLPISGPDEADPVATGKLYQVGAIVIEGTQALEMSDFLDIVAEFAPRTLSDAELGELAARVAGRARERGYVFAAAWIEPQALASGVLRVRLDEGVIDEVRVVGDDDPAVRTQLDALLHGRPVTLAEVERQVLLADDIAGVSVRRTRFEHEGERGILVVEAIRQHFSGHIELENDGSQPIGPERARIDFDLNGLLSAFDGVDLTFSTTPFQPEELQYGQLRYRVVVGTSGTELGVTGSYSVTEPGAYLADRDVFGRAWRVGALVRHPLRRSRDLSLWLEGEFEVRELRQKRDGLLARLDRLPVLRGSLYSLAELGGGRLRGRITLSQGLDILGATRPGDPFASRDDASAEFTTFSASADWTGELSGGVSLALAGQGQLSADPLLVTEEIGLGGSRFLRGYNYRERSGDNGAMAFGELRYDWSEPLGLVRKLQIYAFADGGVVWNLGGGHGGGSLASSGGGVRADVTRNLDLDVELALPLTGPRYDTDDKSPRLNLRVGQSF